MGMEGVWLDEGEADAERTAGTDEGAGDGVSEKRGVETGFIGREESSKY